MPIRKEAAPPSGEDGWTRQFSATEPRLSEMIANYEELGLEVLAVPTAAEQDLDCTACLGPGDGCFTTFTRPRPV